jgi:hypothetical protein
MMLHKRVGLGVAKALHVKVWRRAVGALWPSRVHGAPRGVEGDGCQVVRLLALVLYGVAIMGGIQNRSKNAHEDKDESSWYLVAVAPDYNARRVAVPLGHGVILCVGEKSGSWWENAEGKRRKKERKRKLQTTMAHSLHYIRHRRKASHTAGSRPMTWCR